MAEPHLQHYWVAFTGELRDAQGSAPVDEEVAELSSFLRELTRSLVRNKHIHSPLVSHQGDGTVMLGSALYAPTEGNALDFARAAFIGAIEECGGSSEFPENGHRAWKVDQLQVTSLVPV